ncbi:PA3715 family protein [Flavobacterium sp.]
MRQIILIIAIAFTSLAGVSQQNDLEQTIKTQMSYNDEDFFCFDTRKLADEPNVTLALAVRYSTILHDNDDFTANLLLVLFDTTTNKIINTLEEPRKFTSDAVALQPVVFEFANYKINPKTTAFSISVAYEGSSRVNPYSTKEVFLYTVINRKIVALSNGITISEFHGKWDTKCTFDGKKTTSVLHINKKMTHGFYDLNIKSTKTSIKSVPSKQENEDCIETNTILTPANYLLKFRNTKYSIN